MNQYTYKTVPFKVLKPALKLLMTSYTIVFTQVYDEAFAVEHPKLGLKVLTLKEKTEALENPTRNQLISYITAWYGLTKDLAGYLETSQPAFADILRKEIADLNWLEVAWVYMSEQMAKWVAENKE